MSRCRSPILTEPAFYALPVSGKDDFLLEVNSEMMLDATLIKLEKLRRLLRPPDTQTRRYYRLDWNTPFSVLNIPSVAGSYLSFVARTDVTTVALDMEDFGDSSKSLLEI